MKFVSTSKKFLICQNNSYSPVKVAYSDVYFDLSFQGTRTDELTIKPGDVIEVVEDGDLEQWVKARDQNGQIGYVPEKYLEFPPPSNNNSLNHHSTSSSIYEKSPSIVSSTSGNIYGGSLHADGTLSCISGSSCTSGTSSLTTSSLSSAVNQEDAEVESHTSGGTKHLHLCCLP